MSDLREFNPKLKDRVEELIPIIRNDPELFMAIRIGNTLHVYYQGGRILEMNTCSQKINSGYLNMNDYFKQKYEIKNSKLYFGSVENWERDLKEIKECVKSHAEDKKSREERKLQQAIINKVNSNSSSDYYLVDMEYRPAKVEECGTFDLIAIAKKKVGGKYRLAIIELKQDTKAFEGTSGIAKHVTAFQKFLTDDKCKEARENLRKEIFSMVKTYREFGLPYAKYYPTISSVDEISVNDIQPFLLCVNCGDPKKPSDWITNELNKISGKISIPVRTYVQKEKFISILSDSMFS
jgi:hypothetical protein